GRALQGDLGRSIWSRSPVLGDILGRFRATALLAGASLLLSLVAGVGIGTLSAVRKYSVLDRFTMTAAVVGVSMPSFWIGLVLIVIFALKLRWFPISGMRSPSGGGPGDLLHHLILPAVSLAIPFIAVIARLMRSALLEVLDQDYIRTAAAKGLSRSTIITRHAFKNAF